MTLAETTHEVQHDRAKKLALTDKVRRLIGPAEWPSHSQQWANLIDRHPDAVALAIRDFSNRGGTAEQIKNLGGWLFRTAKQHAFSGRTDR